MKLLILGATGATAGARRGASTAVLAQVLPEVQNAGMLLRASFTLILLAGWTHAAPLARPVGNDQLPKLTITGSVTYDAGSGLPPGSRAIIELRHLPALPNAAAVVDQRIDLDGKQSPVSFELSVDRFKLVAGATYVVRGAIVSEQRVIWTADDVKIDVRPSTVDMSEILLKPVKTGASALR